MAGRKSKKNFNAVIYFTVINEYKKFLGWKNFEANKDEGIYKALMVPKIALWDE